MKRKEMFLNNKNKNKNRTAAGLRYCTTCAEILKRGLVNELRHKTTACPTVTFVHWHKRMAA